MGVDSRIKVAIAALCLAAATQIHADDTTRRLFEQKYADHLPAWCLYTQALPDETAGIYGGARSEEHARVFGPIWQAMHHYCWGLEATFMASSMEDEVMRRHKYGRAVIEFDYVLLRAPDDFILKPEIHTHKGLALEALGDILGAVQAYTEAVQLNGAYEPAYIGLSSCFERLGDPQQALTIIDTALQRIPDSEILLVRREELASAVRPGH